MIYSYIGQFIPTIHGTVYSQRNLLCDMNTLGLTQLQALIYELRSLYIYDPIVLISPGQSFIFGI